MTFKNASVTHKRYGTGTVLDLGSNSLTVRFLEYGTRTFRFPDAFRTELKTNDPDLAQYAADALAVKE